MDFRAFYLLQMEGVKKFAPLRVQFKLFQANMRETIEAILDEGKKQGSVSPEIDSCEMAYHIVACGEGVLLQWVVNPEMDVKRILKSCYRFVSQCFEHRNK